MSHRTALTISVAFALLFAVGILVGRDRLFAEPEAAARSAASPPPLALSTGDTVGSLAVGDLDAPPRVIDIPIGEVLRSGSFAGDDHDRRSGDARDHRHDGGDDHDEEHDDD